jgi:hypothetical protein
MHAGMAHGLLRAADCQIKEADDREGPLRESREK